jgi:ribonuclease HI
VEDGVVKEQVLIPLGDGQVAEREVEGLLNATERAIGSGYHRILIISDSQAALRGILSTAPRSGQFRTIGFDRLIRSALADTPHLRITNLWIPLPRGVKTLHCFQLRRGELNVGQGTII